MGRRRRLLGKRPSGCRSSDQPRPVVSDVERRQRRRLTAAERIAVQQSVALRAAKQDREVCGCEVGEEG